MLTEIFGRQCPHERIRVHDRMILKLALSMRSRNCVIPIVCVRTWELWVFKHNCVTKVQFNDNVLKQLHVSACDGHRQVALGGRGGLKSYCKLYRAHNVEVSTRSVSEVWQGTNKTNQRQIKIKTIISEN